jgi:hypothetical protein
MVVDIKRTDMNEVDSGKKITLLEKCVGKDQPGCPSIHNAIAVKPPPCLVPWTLLPSTTSTVIVTTWKKKKLRGNGSKSNGGRIFYHLVPF